MIQVEVSGRAWHGEGALLMCTSLEFLTFDCTGNCVGRSVSGLTGQGCALGARERAATELWASPCDPVVCVVPSGRLL